MLRPKVNLVVLDPGSGKARPGALVTFYRANTLDLSALYADDDVTGITNPVQANGLGQVAVRLDTGVYDISMTWDGAQPTVVEDVVAWSPSADVITSPGDLIIGNASGAPTRLAVGANGQVLLVDNGLPAWKTLGAGVGMPAGTPGSLLSYDGSGALASILPGLQDQTLVIQGGVPSWASILAAGQQMPINQPGDLVIGAPSTGTPVRLARGNTDDVLKVSSTGGLSWGRTDTVGHGGGHCYLYVVNDSLILLPWEGSQIWIAGAGRTIPTGGTTPVPPSPGYVADTTYFVYAWWDGSAIQLDVSTVSYAEDGAGLMHKSGDASRTLVGMARLIPGTKWGSTQNQRFLLTKFAPSIGQGTAFFTAPRSMPVPNLSYVEINPEIRAEFLCWGWEQTLVSLSGTAQASAAGTLVTTLLVFDGQVYLTGNVTTTAVVNEYFNVATSWVGAFSDGYHYVTVFSGNNNFGATGTVTWHGSPDGVTATRIHILVNGGG
jgi:hypothetical protein